jgi:spore germination cell wall hydrolase CwlJ-like protein
MPLLVGLFIVLCLLFEGTTYKQEESTESIISVSAPIIYEEPKTFTITNVAIDTSTKEIVATATSTLTAAPTPSPSPSPTLQPKQIAASSTTVTLQTIEDFRNNVPEGYTTHELDLLAKLLWGEGRGESDQCQIAIAQAVLNRSRLWKDTIEETIFRSGQFSVAHPKRRFLKYKATVKEYRNAYDAMSGIKVVSDKTIYFHSTRIGKRVWKNHRYVKTINRTSFYEQ